MMHFRLAHFKEVHSIAVSEDILEHSQCRKTENFDVHITPQTLEAAKEELDTWRAEMPTEASSYQVSEGSDALTVSVIPSYSESG